MGKKTKKTKWRTLEIPPPGKRFEYTGSKWEDGRRTPSGGYQQYEKATRRRSSSTSSAVTSANVMYPSKDETKGLVEDEYTKITTPRQDVLFKKGYLTRKKVPETISENSVDQNSDGIAQDCSNNEDFSNYANGDETVQQFMCPGPQSYIDPSALYYGGGYEIYDPYTGNVTVIVGPGTGQYPSNSSCQPILTSVPCRPVPLQPVQWFNPLPSPDWCCSYSSQSDKRYSTDSQNGSRMGSESSGVPESPPEIIEEPLNGSNGPVFPPSYVYPGYMFGAPIYNMDEASAQYYGPESPALSSSELTTSKRRKKKKRRRRTAEAEEESESSLDDPCNRSISSTECTLDSQSQTGSQEYEDDLRTQTAFSTSLHYSSLPHGNVNAPEFVPADLTLTSAIVRCADATAQLTNGVSSSISINATADEPSAESFAKKSTSGAGLNVYCKPFDSRESKHDSESVSGSNNSDSGISSPGSEDISKGDFGEPSRSQNDETKKKPRSKKSNKAKTKPEETKPSVCSQPAKKSNQTAKPVARKEPKKRSEEDESKKEAPKCALKNEARPKKSKIEAVSVPAKTKSEKKKKEARKKKTKPEAVEKTESVEDFDAKPVVLIESVKQSDSANDDVKSESVVQEENNNKIVTDLKSDFGFCNGCDSSFDQRIEDESKPEADRVTVEAVGESTVVIPEDESRLTVFHCSQSASDAGDLTGQPDDTMLNEIVAIEEKPMLAKLVDLAELTESPPALEEISSISEFSSCREPLPRNQSSIDSVESLAKEVVDDVIERAEAQILSSMTCDKLQLPITQAVTRWLNEHGGLPTVLEDSLRGTQSDDDAATSSQRVSDVGAAEPAKPANKSKKSKQNCVIC